jgi:hypothetical protein
MAGYKKMVVQTGDVFFGQGSPLDTNHEEAAQPTRCPLDKGFTWIRGVTISGLSQIEVYKYRSKSQPTERNTNVFSTNVFFPEGFSMEVFARHIFVIFLNISALCCFVNNRKYQFRALN